MAAELLPTRNLEQPCKLRMKREELLAEATELAKLERRAKREARREKELAANPVRAEKMHAAKELTVCNHDPHRPVR